MEFDLHIITLYYTGLYTHSYLYWTEYIHKHKFVTLHRLNIMTHVAETFDSFSSTDHQLSPALTLDPTTDRLWLSNRSSGGIVSCDPSSLPWKLGLGSRLSNIESHVCMFEVNTTVSAASSISKCEIYGILMLEIANVLFAFLSIKCCPVFVLMNCKSTGS